MHETEIYERESSALSGHSIANYRPFDGLVTPMNGQVTFASGIQFYDNLHLCGNIVLCVCVYVCIYVCMCVCIYVYVSVYIYIYTYIYLLFPYRYDIL